MPRTLFDKLWDSHRITSDESGEDLLYVDRVCLHERTGSIALESLEARNIPVRRPGQAFCMMDHVVDTHPGRGDRTAIPGGEAFIVRTRRGARTFGIRTFDIGDAGQGISHVVSAEQGIALPGLSLVCPDSHTCTLGALGTLAFGIGTSETEHALATSTLWLAKPAGMAVDVDGVLEPGVSAKDLVLHLIAELGADGAGGAAVEFRGSAVKALDVESRMTLCNMAVEFAAATALIAPDAKVFEYVTGRAYAPPDLPLRRLASGSGPTTARISTGPSASTPPRSTPGLPGAPPPHRVPLSLAAYRSLGTAMRAAPWTTPASRPAN